ncbi:M48 family metalloprotease [Alginatibacterium sediminis]|nr:M48 family metalloprotease [Alginatibacterium sediminis]
MSAQLTVKIHGWILCCLLVIFSLSFSPPSLALSTELDKKLGAQNAKMVEQQMGIYQDAVLIDYVQQVGARLVAELENPRFDFRFTVIDDPAPNAFALPGGYVYVTRGLLALMINEDELATVLAHEIIHVTERHSIKQLGSSILPRLLEVPGDVVGHVIDEDLGTLLNAPLKTSNNLLASGYSRSHESDSDELGITLAAKAGYNPLAMGPILTRLNASIEYITQQEQRKSYFDDHPFTPDRVKNIKKTSKKLKYSGTSPIDSEFLTRLDGLFVAENPNRGVFVKQLFLHPQMGISIEFPKDWDTVNKPEAVGAVHTDRQSFIFVGLAPYQGAKNNADKFKHQIEEKYHVDVKVNPETTAWNSEAYWVGLIDSSGPEPMYVHRVWLELDNLSYQIVAVSPKAHQQQIEASARSFKPISEQQRDKIQHPVVRVVAAMSDETLDELARRSASEIPSDAIALLNQLELKQKLEKDQAVKIIVLQKYKDISTAQ